MNLEQNFSTENGDILKTITQIINSDYGFGIHLKLCSNNKILDEVCINDICAGYGNIIDFAKIVSIGCVTPTSLMDIVEDYLAIS